jgi:hypothetical protein
MSTNDLQKWLKHPEQLNQETLFELRALIERYPYFQTARLLYLCNLYKLHHEDFGTELRKASLFITDRKVLFNMIEGSNYELKPQKKISAEKTRSQDRTLSLIDSFLDKIPKEKKNIKADATNDYASYLTQIQEEEKEEAPPLKGQELIDQFINMSDKKPLSISQTERVEYPQPIGPELGDSEDENYFTETLAKIYVKQHRYSKALEIIKKLNLKYPKKNAYFADQIRFLEKLIINNKQK